VCTHPCRCQTPPIVHPSLLPTSTHLPQTTLCSTIDVSYPMPGTYYITVTGKTATDEGVFGLRWDTFLGDPPTYSPLPSFTPAPSLSPEHHFIFPVTSGAETAEVGLAFAAVGAAMAAANGMAAGGR
jgi:hypothetical protein